MLQVEPDVERRLWGHRNLQTETREALEDVVALVLEVALQGNLFLEDMVRVKAGDGSEL